MKLDTVMKLIKDNTNVLGYINSKTLIQSLQGNFENMEMRISIVREPECTQTNLDIFNNMIIPLVKAKECVFRQSLDTICVYSRNLFRLRVIDRACSLLNSQMADKYKFKIMTNYDIISEEHNNLVLS